MRRRRKNIQGKGVIPLEKVIKAENEKKKEYLRQYRNHVQRIKRIESDLEEIRIMKRYPSMSSDGMPHGSNGSDLSQYAAVLDSKERELTKERYLRIKGYLETSKQIDLLENDKEKDVLHYRYIKGLDWWEIAEKMHYTENWIHKIHGKALIHFEPPKEYIEIK